MRSSAFRAERFRASRPKQPSSTACRKRAEHIRGGPGASTPFSTQKRLAARSACRADAADRRSVRLVQPGEAGRAAATRGSRIATARSNWKESSLSAITGMIRTRGRRPRSSLSATREATWSRRVESIAAARVRSAARLRARRRPPARDEMVAKQAQSARVDVQHLALLVEQRGGGADQFEAVGDAARPRAGEQRRQRRDGAARRGRRAGARAVRSGWNWRTSSWRPRRCGVARTRTDGGHGSLRSATERDFSAD